MKRWVVVGLIFGLLAAGSAAMYQIAARERAYRALLARGDTSLHDDETYGAIEAYSGAIGLRPDSMLAHLRRGEAYRRRGELETAARDMQSAAALDSTATRPLDELGDIRYEQRQFHAAVEVFERYIRLDDRAPRVSYKLALAQYRDGNVDGAMAALASTFRITDKLPDAYYLQGLCFRDQGRPNDAIRSFEKAVELSPGLIPAREELAELYGASGRRGDELEQLQLIAGLDRGDVERQVAVGLAHARWSADENEPPARRAGHADLAVLTLGGALERRPDQPIVYSALGRVWLELAQSRNDGVALNKALEALSRIGSRDTATSDALTLYGRALLQEGRSDLAESVLREATKRFPVDVSAFTYYSKAAEAQRHFEAARQSLILAGALGVPPTEEPSRALRLGNLSAQLGDFTAAAQWFGRALDSTPDDLDLAATLADAQIRAGNRAAAQATLARGLEKDPGNSALLAVSRRLPGTP